MNENKEALLSKSSASPLAVMAPPDDASELRMFSATVTAELQSMFERRLDRGDLALWQSEGPWEVAATKRIFGLLDKTIVDFAQTFGWRIYLSETVLQRMATWHDTANGPHLIKQLGDAVYLAALVAQGRAKLPVTDPELRATKPHAVNELRRLLKQAKMVFNQYRTRPSDQQVCDWFRTTVETSPNSFPFWSVNIDSLLQHFEREAKRGSALIQRMAIGDVRPGRLFDAWGADVHNLNPEHFRQAVSNLPSSKL